jgi:hypothetical protein
MSYYALEYNPDFENTGLVLVGSGLTRGTWGLGMPGGMSPLLPKINLTNAGLLYTTGDGTKGFLRFYPTTNYKSPVPPKIPDSETIYIEWDAPEKGTPTVTVTHPPLYKVSATMVSDVLKVSAVGAFGPGTCLPGYVWREAFSGDKVCVLPATRAEAAADNKAAASRVDPLGSHGPKSCIAGYLWREAESGDQVCVLPATASQVKADNAAATSRQM